MARPRIVVVNDDALFLLLMQEILEEEGYKAIIQHEGKGAYELIKREMPALVVLDIRLEHPDAGWQVLEQVRLDPHTADVPVLVCSADSRFLRGKARQLRERGCEILEKPFRYDELLRFVHLLVREAPSIEP